MKKAILSLLFCAASTFFLQAQNDYLVTTDAPNRSVQSAEEQFIYDNFPNRMLCDWTPGMKFMFLPEARDMYAPIFHSYETERDANTGSLKGKIFEFIGAEEKASELYITTTYSARFVFECNSVKYYYEIKGQPLSEVCVKNPRVSINGLVYLGDVDIARQVLIGRSFYTKTSTVRVDDPNSYAGSKDAKLPENTRVTITKVGVGTKAYPVKLVFEDANGRSYFMELALSRTNSGMDIVDFQADKKDRYFANALSFNDRNVNTLEAIKSKYVNMPVYPKQNISVTGNFNIDNEDNSPRVHLLRYTSLVIRDINVELPGTLATLTLSDVHGHTYNVETDLKYNVVIKNENFFEDMFAFGDIRKKYPYVTEEDWQLIAMGEVKAGMTTDECRLALGNPVQVEMKKDTRFESWIYPRKVLEFESGRLLRHK